MMTNLICKLKGHNIEVYYQRNHDNGVFYACKRCSEVVQGHKITPRPFEEYEKIAYREQEKRIR